MLEYILIIGIIITLVASLWIIRNLLNKFEALEDASQELLDYVSLMELTLVNTKNTINEANEQLKRIDSKGTFESDDEVGFFFKDLQTLSNELTNFTNDIIEEDDTNDSETE